MEHSIVSFWSSLVMSVRLSQISDGYFKTCFKSNKANFTLMLLECGDSYISSQLGYIFIAIVLTGLVNHYVFLPVYTELQLTSTYEVSSKVLAHT